MTSPKTTQQNFSSHPSLYFGQEIKVVNNLQDGDVFGEMAVLDPEPRLASITALEDTQLLRLDRQPFYEVMEDRVEVAYGVIHVLSDRLRGLSTSKFEEPASSDAAVFGI